MLPVPADRDRAPPLAPTLIVAVATVASAYWLVNRAGDARLLAQTRARLA